MEDIHSIGRSHLIMESIKEGWVVSWTLADSYVTEQWEIFREKFVLTLFNGIPMYVLCRIIIPPSTDMFSSLTNCLQTLQNYIKQIIQQI